MVDYSRFNGICDSDEEAEEAPVSSPERLQPRRTRPPPDVLDDLEDYFRRMDERTRSDASAEAASVDRFDEPSLDKLEVCAFPSALPCSDTCSPGYTECAICLSEFEESDPCISLPCAARHLFHAECIKAHLRRSVTCPLCRVDLKAILSLRARESERESEREGERESIEADLEPASPPRGSGGTSGGYSRGGGGGRGAPPPGLSPSVVTSFAWLHERWWSHSQLRSVPSARAGAALVHPETPARARRVRRDLLPCAWRRARVEGTSQSAGPPAGCAGTDFFINLNYSMI